MNMTSENDGATNALQFPKVIFIFQKHKFYWTSKEARKQATICLFLVLVWTWLAYHEYPHNFFPFNIQAIKYRIQLELSGSFRYQPAI